MNAGWALAQLVIEPHFQITKSLFDRIQELVAGIMFFEEGIYGLKAISLFSGGIRFFKIIKRAGITHSVTTSSKFSSSQLPACQKFQ